MRARGIKPQFFTDEHIVQLSPWARILFVGLWCAADREGRLEDRPAQLKINLFPCDDVDVDNLLDEIAASPGRLILRYTVGEHRYIQVVNFNKHQSPHMREQASTIPAPDMSGASPVQARLIPSSLTPDSGLLTPVPPKEEAAAVAREERSSIEEENPGDTLPPYLTDEPDPMDALLVDLWAVPGWKRSPKQDREDLEMLGKSFPRADLATAIQQLRAKAADGAVKTNPRSALQAFVKQLHLSTPAPRTFDDEAPPGKPTAAELKEQAKQAAAVAAKFRAGVRV